MHFMLRTIGGMRDNARYAGPSPSYIRTESVGSCMCAARVVTGVRSYDIFYASHEHLNYTELFEGMIWEPYVQLAQSGNESMGRDVLVSRPAIYQ